MDVKSAARVVDLVEAFAEHQKPLSVSDVARVMSVPVSSCHGILRTLEGRGWVYEAKSRGGYYVTRRVLELAQAIAAHDPLIERVEGVAQALRDRTGETVIFGTLQDRRVLYLLVVESPHSVRYSSRAGERRDLHANSIGKAILGAMPAAEQKSLIASLRFTRNTAATLRSARALQADLAASAARGWYANTGESVPEVMAVAMPVAINGGRFGLAVAGPIQRIQPALDGIVDALHESVRRLAGTA